MTNYKLVKTRHGLMVANPQDQYIGSALIKYGEFSELEWALLKQIVKPGHNIIEVGANIGVHTVSLARAVGPQGRVWAFEPQHIIFQNMCANIALNNLTNVYAYNAGCGDKADEILIPDINYAKANNYGGVALEDLEKGEGKMPIPIVRLDKKIQADRIDLIKIDVEGMEENVLKGAQGLIKKHKPILYIENDRTEKSQSLIKYIFKLGYKIWWHCPPLFNPDNMQGVKDNAYGKIVSVNMLCLPNDSETKVTDLKAVEKETDRPF